MQVYEACTSHPFSFGPTPNWKGIPKEIQDGEWCVWKAKPKTNGKFDKIPCNNTGNITKKGKWLTYEEAKALYSANTAEYNGVGRRMSLDDSFVYGDVDNSKKLPKGWPNTYLEVSPSGKGLHAIWLAETLPHDDTTTPHEMYSGHGGRFLTITGVKVNRKRITKVNGELADWVRNVKPKERMSISNSSLPTIPLYDTLEPVEHLVITPGSIEYLTTGIAQDRSVSLFKAIGELYQLKLSDSVIMGYLCGTMAINTALDHRHQDYNAALEYLWNDCKKQSAKYTKSIETREEAEDQLHTFNEYHGLVRVDGKTFVVERQRDSNTGYMRTILSNINEIKTYFKNQTIIMKNSKGDPKRIPIITAWETSELQRKYTQAMFKPIAGLVAQSRQLPDTKEYNFYQGLNVTPKKGNCTKIKKHILETWCNNRKNIYHYIMSWMANMFQRPDNMGMSAIVLHSGEGTGKNLIIENILAQALGTHATMCTRPEDISGRFNAHLAESVLVYLNEAVWGGDKNKTGTLKSLITDRTLSIERKFMPKITVRNCTHIMLSSNEEWVAPIGMQDRRWCVLDLNERWRQNHDYFDKLVHEIESGGREAFIYELLNFDISSFNPGKIPQTNSITKKLNQLLGAHSVTQWWFEYLRTGLASSARITTPSMKSWDKESILLNKSILHTEYLEWMEQHKKGHPSTDSAFAREMRKICFIKNARPTVQDKRENCYAVYPLAECREQFNEKTNTNMNWEE